MLLEKTWSIRVIMSLSGLIRGFHIPECSIGPSQSRCSYPEHGEQYVQGHPFVTSNHSRRAVRGLSWLCHDDRGWASYATEADGSPSPL
jgi:hypothetical protein